MAGLNVGREGIDGEEGPTGASSDAGSNPARSTTHRMAEMPQEDWDALGVWIRETANALGLRDWYIVLSHDPPDSEEALAQVESVRGRKFASIRVCRDFRELSNWEQRNALVHELLHPHIHPIAHYLNDVLPGALGGPTAHAIMTSVQTLEEYAVDALATALCDGFPDVPWVTPLSPGQYGSPITAKID